MATTTTTTATTSAGHVDWFALSSANDRAWMLGDYQCPRGTCVAIVRSDNRGTTWVRVGAPSVYLPPPGGAVPLVSLTFANRQDGYAYGPANVYWTHDGGITWHRAPLPPLAATPYSVVTTAGHAFTVVTTCRSGPCSSYALASSSVTSTSWRTMPLPGLEGDNVTLAAFGSRVWIVAVSQGGGEASILISTNGGRSFSELLSKKGPLGLGCSTEATSTLTLWGACATGMAGYAWRSSDGGRSFHSFHDLGLPNAAFVVPISDDEALVVTRETPELWLTRNGGRTAMVTLRFPVASSAFTSAVAVTRTTWLATGSNGTAAKVFRTTNGGVSWQMLPTPSA